MKSRAQMSRAASSDMRDQDESVADNDDADDHDHEDGSETTEDRAQTFRKRRLSLDNLRQTAQDAEKQQLHRTQKEGEVDEQEEDGDDDPFSFFKEPPPPGVLKGDDVPPPQENDKAQSFRKRRLSLTLAKENGDDKDPHVKDGEAASTHNISEVVEPPPQRSRRLDDSSVLFSSSTGPSSPPPPQPLQERVPSRTVHASDLLAHKPISTSSSNHVLYQQKNAPPQRPTLDTLIPPQDMPSWTQSVQHHQQEQHSLHNQQNSGQNSSNPLPFPKYVVGTYSCHGVEPIYDTYLYDEDANFHVAADEEDMEDPPHHAIQTTHPPHGKNEKPPTTAAKINQDRGGVSFPYGNSPRTALFAVYDGT